MTKQKKILTYINRFYKWLYRQTIFSEKDHGIFTSDEMFALVIFQNEFNESFSKLIKALKDKT